MNSSVGSTLQRKKHNKNKICSRVFHCNKIKDCSHKIPIHFNLIYHEASSIPKTSVYTHSKKVLKDKIRDVNREWLPTKTEMVRTEMTLHK